VARVLADERALEGADPWSRRDGWRLHGGARRRLELQADGRTLAVAMQRQHDGATTLHLGDRQWPLATRVCDDGRHEVRLGDQRHVLAVYVQGERFHVFAAQGSAVLLRPDPLAHAGDHAGEAGRLTAPMPGKLIAFLAKAGDTVRRGQPLAVMEAMKMEHTITAPRDGTVGALLFAAGDPVAEGAELLTLSE
jgi:3-methylcrotonyl-CoA carboxylase alpha subunit